LNAVVTPAAIVWFWRGLRGHSVTFAALFASVLLGASIAGLLHRLLSALGVHWLFVLILPAVLFGWLARREARWIPDERRRRVIARSLLLGSIGLAILISSLRPARPTAPAAPAAASPAAGVPGR
jgi:phosphotransferase system  glucose/maltose/N-acetylglucosamine-specific IIC component